MHKGSAPRNRLFRGHLKGLTVFILVILASFPALAQLSESAQKQIAEVLAFKQSFSPAEQKMSSNLVLLSRKARHIPLGNLERFATAANPDAQGKVAVDIGADLSPALMSSRVMSNIIGTDAVPQHSYGIVSSGQSHV